MSLTNSSSEGPPSSSERIEFRCQSPRPTGHLDDVSIAELLHACHVQEANATVLLRNDLVDKLIYLLDGKVAFVESDLRSETLGAYLLRTERLGKEDHRMIFEQMRQTGRRQGELILERGLLNPNELYSAMLAHVTEKVVTCFAWEHGDYVIESGGEWSGHVLNLKIDPSRVILDGVKRFYTKERLKRLSALKETSRAYLRLDAPAQIEALHLTTSEARVYDLVSHDCTIGKIVEASSDREEALRVLYGLFILEIVGFDVGGKVKPSLVPSKTPAPRRAPLDVPESTKNQELENKLIADYLRLKDADHFTVLDVERTAGNATINMAFRKQTTLYEQDVHADLPSVSRDKADELYVKLLTAYRVLSNPKQRRGYIDHLGRKKTEKQRSSATGALESDELFEKAKRALDEERPQDAIELLKRALSLKKGEPLFEAYLGWALFVAKPKTRRRHAEKHLELARRSQPEMHEPYLFMARIYEREGRLERALELYQTAAKNAPADIEIAREANLFAIRLKKGRVGRPAGRSKAKSGSGLNQDVGHLIAKIFSRDKS